MSTAQLDKSKLQLEDSWEAVNAWFLERDMTDGLPIVPPTEPRVLAMTDHAERTLGYAPTDIVATLMPKRGIATIGKIAANAVMAGCKPEYMLNYCNLTRIIVQESSECRFAVLIDAKDQVESGDLENFLHHRSQVRQDHLGPECFRLLRRHHQLPQSG